LVAGCTIRRLGGTAITVAGGESHGIFGCDLHTLGRRGVELIGGDRKTLTPSGHFVENCRIHDFSRIDRTYTPAVQIEGVGHRIAHNKFHDSPGHAMRLEGNDHVVEYNEIYDVVRETDDQGGIDIWGNVTYRGNILRYNHWHDIGNGRACGQGGIRLDDGISGTLVYGNVFERCSDANFGGVQIHGGKDNWIDNNVFVDCRFGVSFSGWGEERWKKYLASDWIRKSVDEVATDRPPYSTRYPELSSLEENPDVNMIWRNLVLSCGQLLVRDKGIQNLMGNYITNQDPGFVSITNGNYALRKGASVHDVMHFRPIPFAAIGLYEHPLRASSADDR
jgi:hypothetical protein